MIATALIDFFHKQAAGIRDYRFLGYANIWVFLAYGCLAFLFPILYSALLAFHIPLVGRVIIYGILMFHVEYFYCRVLRAVFGHCPWGYTGTCAVKEYSSILGVMKICLSSRDTKALGGHNSASDDIAKLNTKGCGNLSNIPAYALFGLLIEVVFKYLTL